MCCLYLVFQILASANFVAASLAVKMLVLGESLFDVPDGTFCLHAEHGFN